MSFTTFIERFLVIQHPHFVVMHLTPQPSSPKGEGGFFDSFIYLIY